MAFRPQQREVNNLNNPCENSKQKLSIPLLVYANKLEEKVKKRYVEKISAIGIDQSTVLPCFGDELLYETAI